MGPCTRILQHKPILSILKTRNSPLKVGVKTLRGLKLTILQSEGIFYGGKP
jgi:hypothetical protein